VKEVGVVVEKALLMKCSPVEAPVYLLAAYYAYNMKYPEGLDNFFLFLEYIALGKACPKNVSQLGTLYNLSWRPTRGKLISFESTTNIIID